MSIKEDTEIFTIKYPQAVEFTNTQLEKCYWTPSEIKVEKDIHDVLVNLTEAEKHGVFTTLKLFTLYELRAGADYWTGRFMRTFPRHELAAMGATFGMVELAVHKPFYNKINELLNATDETFYTDYVNNPILKERMQFIDSIIDHPNDLISLAGFSMVEGVILYSSFAFLKHFQSNGKNKLMNIVRGINYSVRDENLHSMAGAWVFRELASEMGVTHTKELIEEIHDMAVSIYTHECAIIDMIFEKGEIEGVTEEEMYLFVANRIDNCLNNLGLPILYDVRDSTISSWFYEGINKYQFNDFFTGKGREYVRSWNEEEFTW